jgi:hypothetical protein
VASFALSNPEDPPVDQQVTDDDAWTSLERGDGGEASETPR